MFDTANTEADWKKLWLDKGANICRSTSDVLIAIEAGETALSKVPGQAVAAFLNGLLWAKTGIFAGADYTMLASHLSSDEIMSLWEMFGLGRNVAQDYDGMKCEGAGTCADAALHICTNNCIF